MTPNEFKRYRYKLDLSQEYMGNLLGLSMRQIIRYESGTTPIPRALAILIEILATRTIPETGEILPTRGANDETPGTLFYRKRKPYSKY